MSQISSASMHSVEKTIGTASEYISVNSAENCLLDETVDACDRRIEQLEDKKNAMMMKWTAAVNESEQRLHEILRLRANLNAKNERITELELQKERAIRHFKV